EVVEQPAGTDLGHLVGRPPDRLQLRPLAELGLGLERDLHGMAPSATGALERRHARLRRRDPNDCAATGTMVRRRSMKSVQPAGWRRGSPADVCYITTARIELRTGE